MSSIDNVKYAMGWQHPTLRDRCANCNHVERQPPLTINCKPTLVCGKGKFYTVANAVCKDHAGVGS